MEIDITGLETGIHLNIFGYDIIIFHGLLVIIGALAVMLVLGIVLRVAVAKQDITKKPSAVLVLAESLWNFSGGSVEGLDEKTHKTGLHIFAANLFIFLLLINTAGLWGLEPPASNAFIAIGLGLMIGLMVHGLGITHGIVGYIKEFFKPNPVMFPINLIEVFSQIISISMRLFGNMLAGIVLAQLLKMFFNAIGLPAFVLLYPTIGGLLSMYSDLFIAGIQSLIFMTLTISYIKGKLVSEA